METNVTQPQRLAVLGSTGSVGISTLDVVARQSRYFDVVALTAHNSVSELMTQVNTCDARFAGVTGRADSVQQALSQTEKKPGLTLLTDIDAVCELIRSNEIDTVVAAIVGAAGLQPVLSAVEAGKRVLVANKEPMVMLGSAIMQSAARSGATLLPLDSEHNAIFQCLPSPQPHNRHMSAIRKLTLTASGGPFRKTPLTQLSSVTPQMACAHPNWDMGQKISVDSATMMNKGLEIIEACHLFSVDESAVDVVVHPQSIIHSWVEYVDGSVIAHLANPDMRVPIAHALAWPDRFESGVDGPSMVDIARLDFEEPDLQRFPCLRLARESIRTGGTAPTILNAANEIAVERFLAEEIVFTDIAVICATVLDQVGVDTSTTLDAVLEADRAARVEARRWSRLK